LREKDDHIMPHLFIQVLLTLAQMSSQILYISLATFPKTHYILLLPYTDLIII
jgi:hypothetical protein